MENIRQQLFLGLVKVQGLQYDHSKYTNSNSFSWCLRPTKKTICRDWKQFFSKNPNFYRKPKLSRKRKPKLTEQTVSLKCLKRIAFLYFGTLGKNFWRQNLVCPNPWSITRILVFWDKNYPTIYNSFGKKMACQKIRTCGLPSRDEAAFM